MMNYEGSLRGDVFNEEQDMDTLLKKLQNVFIPQKNHPSSDEKEC